VRLPRLRLRSLLFLVWLFALLSLGAADRFHELRGDHVQIVDERVNVGGPGSVTLLWQHSYSFGGIPLGPSPTAVLCGVVFVVSLAAWVILNSRGRPLRP
jgi:hypothetical protein